MTGSADSVFCRRDRNASSHRKLNKDRRRGLAMLNWTFFSVWALSIALAAMALISLLFV